VLLVQSSSAPVSLDVAAHSRLGQLFGWRASSDTSGIGAKHPARPAKRALQVGLGGACFENFRAHTLETEVLCGRFGAERRAAIW
jgi:hypothetical protein